MGDCNLGLVVNFNTLTKCKHFRQNCSRQDTHLAKNFVRPTRIVSKTPDAIADIEVSKNGAEKVRAVLLELYCQPTEQS
jgi:hypothetical protein